jgi:hypothetical protein
MIDYAREIAQLRGELASLPAGSSRRTALDLEIVCLMGAAKCRAGDSVAALLTMRLEQHRASLSPLAADLRALRDLLG